MDKENKRKNGPLPTSARCICTLRTPKDCNLLLAGIYRCRITKEQLADIKDEGYLTIGCSPQNNIVVTNIICPLNPKKCVEELHCFVYQKGKTYWIYDNSTTGTMIEL